MGWPGPWLGPSSPVPPAPPGAVCKYCKPRESELYQKEVRLGEGWGERPAWAAAEPPIRPSAGVTPERPGGALLAPVDAVPALSGQPARGRHLHQVRSLCPGPSGSWAPAPGSQAAPRPHPLPAAEPPSPSASWLQSGRAHPALPGVGVGSCWMGQGRAPRICPGGDGCTDPLPQGGAGLSPGNGWAGRVPTPGDR